MTLEQLVPTLEVCQQLKAAGFPQDTAMVWVIPIGIMGLPIPYVSSSGDSINHHFKCIAAPTAGELEEWLRVKYPDATILSFRRGDFGMDADIDDDTLNYHNGVGMYPTLVAAYAALVLEVAG